MVSNIKSLEVGLSVFVVDKSDFTALFCVHDVAQQQVIVAEEDRRVRLYKRVVKLIKFFSQFSFTGKFSDDPEACNG